MYASISEIKQANRAAGFTWFGEREMHAFGTVIIDEVYGGRYFVTYDTDGGSIKGFTIRECDDDGDVHTARESAGLCGYRTAGEAARAASALANTAGDAIRGHG